MNTDSPAIVFTLVYNNCEYPVQVLNGQYYSLMTLVAGHLGIPGFGLCCGMGSCGTCAVDIQYRHSPLKRTVLSCDVPVDDELADAVVFISPGLYQM